MKTNKISIQSKAESFRSKMGHMEFLELCLTYSLN